MVGFRGGKSTRSTLMTERVRAKQMGAGSAPKAKPFASPGGGLGNAKKGNLTPLQCHRRHFSGISPIIAAGNNPGSLNGKGEAVRTNGQLRRS